MNRAAELLHEASATLSHSAAILRLASMETTEQRAAAELWRTAKAVEALGAKLERLLVSLEESHPAKN